jgi:hypothetical protein
MSVTQRMHAGWLVPTLIVLAVATSSAEVTRLEVKSRTDLPGFNYEKVVGRIHFAVDPTNAHNAVIVDLDKAKKNTAGRVEFSADFYMLKPKPGGTSGVLVDIVNRGRLTFGRFSSTGGADPVGDGFLLKRGFTVVAVGWEFDVASADGVLRLDAPIPTDRGQPITGMASALFIPDRRDPMVVTALAGYTAVEPNSQESVLTVRDSLSAGATRLPRDTWTISSTNLVSVTGGFEPGRIYEITYKAANPPVAGLGFAAVRDVVAWLRQGADSMAPVRFAYTFGASQSGRFLREFLYEGFNTDERGSRVFDGVMAHIAGAGRLDLNSRWSMPVECCSTYATAFPFSVQAQRDPVSGATEGLLDNDRARSNQPKLFLTNTGVEYWSSGGRAAALTHSTPDGGRDIAQAENVRVYLMAGTQHGTGPFPPTRGAGQQLLNPTVQSWALRSLLVAMDRWVRDGVAPPASRHPRVDQGTLVDVKNVAFPMIPGVHSPLALTAGARMANPFLNGGAGAGATLPLLVPQVDQDGNERSGIRMPEVAVPLATYTGWNFRAPSVGSPDRLYPLLGSYIPFARTKAEREERKDPRPSIAERYATRDAYLAKINESTATLVKDGFLLAEDVAPAVARASAHWDLVMGSATTSTR